MANESDVYFRGRLRLFLVITSAVGVILLGLAVIMLAAWGAEKPMVPAVLYVQCIPFHEEGQTRDTSTQLPRRLADRPQRHPDSASGGQQCHEGISARNLGCRNLGDPAVPGPASAP